MAEPEILYHYTTAAGLIGIVQSQTLWATNAEFLNDAQELLCGRPQVRDALLKQADELSPADSEVARRSSPAPPLVLNAARVSTPLPADCGYVVGGTRGRSTARGATARGDERPRHRGIRRLLRRRLRQRAAGAPRPGISGPRAGSRELVGGLHGRARLPRRPRPHRRRRRHGVVGVALGGHADRGRAPRHGWCDRARRAR